MCDMSNPPVSLPAAVQTAIIAHARTGKPEEICGILRGRGLTAYESIRGRNIAPERIENYEVDPQTLLRQFEFEDQGEEMMGIYHSHPVTVAYPSATDAWNAHYPDCIYFICSLEHDDAPVIRAFRMTPHFLELDWAALKQALPVYETRPRLFAYYQPPDAPLPPALRALNLGATAPFYVVMLAGEDGALDGRVVTVAEHPVQVTP
jgi:proteasome lid subunit RPN8/RPN11